jgi:hypothetical protein
MDGSTRKEVAKPQGEEEKGQAQQKGERERETRMTTGRKGREVSYTIANISVATGLALTLTRCKGSGGG